MFSSVMLYIAILILVILYIRYRPHIEIIRDGDGYRDDIERHVILWYNEDYNPMTGIHNREYIVLFKF